ncbi:CDP-glycerol glycerophosphotransferase family protein [Clostridium sp. VAP41]|uniref:CDP-glycerol glycerophosphotransferase family protein n=1 Tax=Clostridium sp. VAP41 TaxID=2949979 RepID=UPI0020794A75|nr:CDP-glycerol glycerophosphotransferase family protein [Clostridium sp. VAP41]
MKIIQYIKSKGIKRLFQVVYIYKIDRFYQKILKILCDKKKLKNILIIESHNDFDCNGGTFYNYLIENNYNKKYKIVWLLKNSIPKELPQNVVAFYLYKPSIRKMYYTCIAKYFLADCVVTDKIRHDQKSFYLTHGPIGLKSVKGVSHLPESVDYICEPSEFFASIAADQLELEYPNKKFIYVGYPCHDLLYKESNKEIQKITNEQFNKTIVWMPTFRKGGGFCRNDSKTVMQMGIPIINNEEMYMQLNKLLLSLNILLIIKIHPMQDLSDLKIRNTSNIIVLTARDMKQKKLDNYRLLRDTDALISDYSSIAYDYLHLNRPIAYDFSDVQDYTRGLCVKNIDDFIAGPIINNYEELLLFIKKVGKNVDEYSSQRMILLRKLFQYTDGNSCKRLVAFMGLDNDK